MRNLSFFRVPHDPPPGTPPGVPAAQLPGQGLGHGQSGPSPGPAGHKMAPGTIHATGYTQGHGDPTKGHGDPTKGHGAPVEPREVPRMIAAGSDRGPGEARSPGPRAAGPAAELSALVFSIIITMIHCFSLVCVSMHWGMVIVRL
jgi:hypothetical protein